MTMQRTRPHAMKDLTKPTLVEQTTIVGAHSTRQELEHALNQFIYYKLLVMTDGMVERKIWESLHMFVNQDDRNRSHVRNQF